MNILFVCSGNTCRSPMADGYLNSKNIVGLRAVSCGFLGDGHSVSENAVLAMKELGIDISQHKSRLITKELLKNADKIYCMGESHKTALLTAGVDMQKVAVLGGGISDPFGQDISVYRSCRDEIISAIDTLLFGGEFSPAIILTATESNAAKIGELEKKCFSSPWSENAIVEAMRHNTIFFKALYDGDFSGYISVTAVAGEGYINNIAVKEKYRGKGIGTLLLHRAIAFSKDKKLDFLSLEVRKSNRGAVSLYNKLGFKEVGERKNFYENPRENGVIMTRKFNL